MRMSLTDTLVLVKHLVMSKGTSKVSKHTSSQILD